MKIKVYGSGCPKCKELFDNAQAALDVAGMDAEIEKVTDMGAIVAAGVMMTPALEIDGQVVSSGKVLSAKEILDMLPQAGEGSGCSCCSCGCGDTHKEETPKSCGGETAAKAASACCCSGGSPAKKLLTYMLLTFVGVAVAVMLIRENRAPSAAAVQDVAETSALVVYYFHGNMRCVTCNKFEALVKETLAERFGDETAKGRLTLQIVNVDKPENEHFIKDYGLTTQSVVLAKGGDFRNLDQIWTVIDQGDAKFKEYVAQNIREMLGEAK